MIIAEVCKYAPKYAGNFIDSLLSIESVAKERNVEIKLLFLFPMSAQNLDWVSKLAVTHKVFSYLREEYKKIYSSQRYAARRKWMLRMYIFMG